MNNHRGFTLIELLAVLLLLSVMMGMAMPRTARWRDAAAVGGARDELAARLAWTRIAAASQGGATLILEIPDGRYRVELADGRTALGGDLANRFGVRVEAGGVQDSVVLRYDALGIGRMTGRTLGFRRGDAMARLTVSPYGRYRRW
jgi:prepilin-type N-terminal cleavage/methylation domain-containing protein